LFISRALEGERSANRPNARSTHSPALFSNEIPWWIRSEVLRLSRFEPRQAGGFRRRWALAS
jgi:hypothetical protein